MKTIHDAITETTLLKNKEAHSAGIAEPGNNNMEIGQDGQTGSTRPLRFVCPICGGDQIIERIIDKRRIRVFENGELEGSHPDGWDRYNCIYLCGDCGSVIEHEQLIYFKDRVHLGRWLSQNPEWNVREEETTERRIVIDMSVVARSSEEFLRPVELPFVCPECGARELDECWCTETPIRLYDDGSAELGDPDYDDDYYHYQCRRCRWELVDEGDWLIQDTEALLCFLKANPGNSSNP